MQATIVDLRYHMKKVLEAINRNEKVSVLYHKKEIAMIIPIQERSEISVKDHPFFGMLSHENQSVKEKMDQLRKERYRDI